MYLGRPGFETLRRLVLRQGSHPNVEMITGTVSDVRPDPANHSSLNKVIVKTDSGVREFSAVLVTVPDLRAAGE
ncbi:hypothetical protein B0H10DRAFT_2215767 [Mycena sp. CBHHK59/15]|nr:hypothetical protein B0H10DRAFT_2215767 [Mycena sp. CBHHK59/15]